jgi:hypothetical protein
VRYPEEVYQAINEVINAIYALPPELQHSQYVEQLEEVAEGEFVTLGDAAREVRDRVRT